MLNKLRAVAFVPASKNGGAKDFYSKKLQLKLISEDPFALVYALKDADLRVTPVAKHVPAGFTVLGWESPDIKAEAKRLSKRGVVFEQFHGFQQDELGIWTSPSGAKVAWFKDPDGNILSITEPAKPGSGKKTIGDRGKKKTVKKIGTAKRSA